MKRASPSVNPVEISGIIFVCVFAGGLLGVRLRSVLPEDQLNTDTKELVKLGVGLIGTMAALLLGLLVASAKGSYDARSSEVTQMAANVILLDRGLAHYGPATGSIRNLFRAGVARMIDDLWSTQTSQHAELPIQTFGEVVDQLQELEPHSNAQRALQSQLESIMINIGQTRLLLLAQGGTSISTPFLVVVVFWLTLLFVSFGLFAPTNLTAVCHPVLGCDLDCRCAVSNLGARSSVFRLDPDLQRALAYRSGTVGQVNNGWALHPTTRLRTRRARAPAERGVGSVICEPRYTLSP